MQKGKKKSKADGNKSKYLLTNVKKVLVILSSWAVTGKNIMLSIKKYVLVFIYYIIKELIIFVSFFCNSFNKIFQYLHRPSDWQAKDYSLKQIFGAFLLFIIYSATGVVFNSVWKFPKFFVFFPIFSVILISSIAAEFEFTKKLGSIRALTVMQDGFTRANTFFTRLELSTIFFLVPSAIVLIFGIGGMSLYKSFSFSWTLIWCLVLFSIVVYISIIGYIQYILLFFYIYLVANDSTPYKSLIKPNIHIIPAEIDWLKKLASISHVYRSVFFTLGSLYIIAFYCFCFSPEFKVMTSHAMFYLLWSIIFVAIVLIFPLVSFLEFIWIKKIVEKVKQSYIADLNHETELFDMRTPDWSKSSTKMIKSTFAITILGTKNYPIPNRLSTVYAAIIGLINFMGTIITALQFMGVSTLPLFS